MSSPALEPKNSSTQATEVSALDPAAPQTFLQAVPESVKLYPFLLLNLTAYSLASGDAVKLMARHWGATEAYMGILMAIIPASNLIQLVAAPFIERVGLKRFVFFGQILRNLSNILLAVLPFVALSLFGYKMALVALLVVMVLFDLSHGLAFAPWMTWLTHLVPEKWRGRYFSIEQLMIGLGMMFIAWASGEILGKEKDNVRYGTLLAVGAACGCLSLMLLARLKSPPKLVEKKDAAGEKNAAVPMISWIADIFRIASFRKYMLVVVSHQLMLSLGGFGFMFLNEDLKIDQALMMKMGAVGTLGNILSVYFWGVLADKYGSKPIMALAYRLVIIGPVFWLITALLMPKVTPLFVGLIIASGLLMAAGLTGYVIVGFRYVMSSVPQEKMVYGTVMYNQTVQLTATLGPLMWGFLLKMTKGLNLTIGPLHIHRFVLMYGLMVGFAIIAKMMIWRLDNKESDATATTVLRDVLSDPIGIFRQK